MRLDCLHNPEQKGGSVNPHRSGCAESSLRTSGLAARER